MESTDVPFSCSWIFFFETPSEIFTFTGVLPVKLHGLTILGEALYKMSEVIRVGRLDDRSYVHITDVLSRITREFDRIGLNFTSVYAKQIDKDLRKLSMDELAQRFFILSGRLHDELETIHGLCLTAKEMAYYENTELCGAQFKISFPKANSEVIEAGNCFALGRYAGAVFHLMRAAEVALFSLFSELKLPPPQSSTWSWNDVLTKVDAEIKRRTKAIPMDPQWALDRSFFEETYAFLSAARNPLRNATMHVSASYDEAGAENVFNAMRAFLSHISKRLKE